MTSTNRAKLESGYHANGKAYGYHLPAGTRVAIRVRRNGQDTNEWKWHILTRDVVTGRGDQPTNEDHPIDKRMTRDLYDIGTARVDGFEVRYIRHIEYYGGLGAADLPRMQDVRFSEHPCLCGGKGEIEEGFYGRLKGCRWRVKCGKNCTWKKPAKK